MNIILGYAVAVIAISAANIHYSSQPNNSLGTTGNTTICNIYNIHYINYNFAIGHTVLGIIIILIYMCIQSEIAKQQDLNQEVSNDDIIGVCGMIILPTLIIQFLSYATLAHGDEYIGDNQDLYYYYKSIWEFAPVGCNPTQVWLIYASLLTTGLPSILVGVVIGLLVGGLILIGVVGGTFYAITSWVWTFACGRVWCYDCDKQMANADNHAEERELAEINSESQPNRQRTTLSYNNTNRVKPLGMLSAKSIGYTELPMEPELEPQEPPPYDAGFAITNEPK